MLELALDTDNKGGILQKDIARKQNISNRYLDHIISALKAAGLITNIDGKKSGYKLAKTTGSISMYDIYKAFANKMQIMDCLADDKSCPYGPACSAREFWKKLNNCIVEFMESVKLTEIANRQKLLNETHVDLMYHI